MKLNKLDKFIKYKSYKMNRKNKRLKQKKIKPMLRELAKKIKSSFRKNNFNKYEEKKYFINEIVPNCLKEVFKV